MVDILFLGSGGGRFNLVRQTRGTGGFLLLGQTGQIHVDPGPGALVRLHQCGQDALKTDCIIVSHMHVDHVSDAPVLVEAMSGHGRGGRGTLIAPPSVLDGDRNGDRSVSKYHQAMVPTVIRPQMGQRIEVALGQARATGPSGAGPTAPRFSFTPVPTKHDDKEGFGFVLEWEGVRIGYTSDTEYLPAVHDAAFRGVDVLVANNLKTAEDGIPDHLHSGDLITLLGAAKPGMCILNHMGLTLIQSGPEAEAARIESASGVPTVAAADGKYYCTDRCGWFDAAKESAAAR